jgi:hypothetical protein
MRSVLHILAPAVLLASLFASPAAAQEADSFDEIRLSNLPTVYAVDESDRETKGRLVRLTPSSITLLVDGSERTFEAAKLKRLEKKGDSLRNGALTGAVIGTLLTIAAVSESCPRNVSCGGAKALYAVASIGGWTALGTAIDAALPGRTLLWTAPRIRW